MALGSFGMDSHVVQHFVTESGHANSDGVIWRVPPKPYGISYRSIIPRKGECENLFSPICVSASHVAYGSIRMEPVFMALSQSAAIAAGMAIDSNVSVQDVPYPALREELEAAKTILRTGGRDGSVVTYYWYRFADQPAVLNADMSEEEREALQSRVEMLHRSWKKERDYLAPPAFGKLAELDPALIVTPPPGLEIGYVAIVTRQAAGIGQPNPTRTMKHSTSESPFMKSMHGISRLLVVVSFLCLPSFLAGAAEKLNILLIVHQKRTCPLSFPSLPSTARPAHISAGLLVPQHR